VIDDLKLKEVAPIASPVKPQTNTTDNSNTVTGTESSTNKHSPKAKEPKRQILPSKSDMQKHMIETEPVIDLATSTQESETVSKLRQKYGY
jgi:hypothetical protein